jgi:Na+-driven multidrug efflux pump
MVICSNYIYKIWIRQDLMISSNLTLTMAIYVIINLWNGIYSQFLNGVGKIKLQLIIAVVGGVINIPLSFYLCKYLGNYG